MLDSKPVEHLHEGRTVLITGAAGTIGSELSKQLVKTRVKEIILFDINENDLYLLRESLLINHSELVRVFAVTGDITRFEDLNFVFAQYRPDIVFHAAAYKQIPMSQDQPSIYFRTNVLGTKNVADLCIQHRSEKMILISTDKAIEPINVLGATKLLAEKYLKRLSLADPHNCSFITCRFGNVFGSRGSVLPLWKMQIANGGTVTVTHPEATRYFMTSEQAGEFLLTSGKIGGNGDLLWYDIGEPIRILDLAKKVIADSGQDTDIEFIGLRPGEKLHEESMLPKIENHKQVATNVYCCLQEFDDEFGNEFNLLEKDLSNLNDVQVLGILGKLVPEFVHSSNQLV